MAPVVGTPEAALPRDGGVLVVDWHGMHALIRRSDDLAREADVLNTVPTVPGNLLIVASAAAYRDPTLLTVIRGCLGSLWSVPAESRPQAAWLAVSDLGNPNGACVGWLYGLAAEAGMEIFAPHGEVRALLGTGTYVDRATGGTGWRRFRPGTPADVVGCRFPMPYWEHRLPHIPLRAAGLIAEPIPAGLAVHVEDAVQLGHRELAFRVPASPRMPKVVLGGPGSELSAHAVAELLSLLPADLRRELIFVPSSARMSRPEWAQELAKLAGHEIAVSAGSQVVNPRRGPRTVVLGDRGEELLTPFGTLFLQRPDGELPEVVDIAPAPLGWTWAGPRAYQPMRDPNQTESVFPGVLVEVVPGGLAVHTEGTATVAIPFDPARWTLGVGTPGSEVTEVELAAVRSLLNGLTTQQRVTVCVRVFGELAPPVQTMLDTYVRAVGAAAFAPEASAAPIVRSAPKPVETPELPQPPIPVPPVFAAPAAPPVAVAPPAPPVSAPVPSVPPVFVAPVSPMPVSPVFDEPAPPIASVPMAPVPMAEVPVAPVAPQAPPPPVTVTAVPVSTVSGPGRAEPKRAPSPPPAVPAVPVPETVTPEPVAPPVQAMPAPEPPPALPMPPAPPQRRGPSEPVVLADRASTPAEQARLGDSAGPLYTEALATVNVALSTWPMLRPEAKADYIAVCLYLGNGEGGAVPLNSALGAGEPVAFDGYLPCLMSGLRRLPTHRQVVLRQENLEEDPFPAGTVLVEPTFLSASARLDVTTAEASLDVLIWPVSARRTSELVMGRAVDEAVFPPGRRFKVLAVRTDTAEPDEETEGPRTPATALLARELLTGEDPTTADAAARDTAALSRLERALATRRAADARLVDDPDAVARLTTPLTVAAETGQSLEMVS